MKKSTLLPIIASSLLFGACSPSLVNNSILKPNANPANLYAFQAATSIGLVSNAVNSPSVMMAQSKADADEALTKEIISYLPAVEAALTGTESITNSKEEVSDLPEYETKLTISYKDIALNETTFTMYYTEVFEGEEAKPEEDKEATTEDVNTSENEGDVKDTSETTLPVADLDDEEDDREDDEEESEDTERESKLTGIIVMGENTYPMHGEKELEVDEYEVSFTYNIDENTTITVEQEIENGEQEFEYEIVSNGETIYEYSIELENDEVELEVKEAGKTENTIKFELETKEDETLIVAHVEQGKDETKLTFKKAILDDGTYEFQLVK